MAKTTKITEKKMDKLVVTPVPTRGRTFQGEITKKFDRRVVVEFDRTVKIKKYERFMRKKTKLHARIPEGMILSVGDYVEVRECRPLSKIINFVVIKMIRNAQGVDKQ